MPPLAPNQTLTADLIRATTGKPTKVGTLRATLDSSNRFTYRIEWTAPAQNPKTEGLLELGWIFTMPPAYDHFTWSRQSRWTIYPPTHIARPTGTALPDTMDNEYTQLTRPDAFDFNSTKYDCDWVTLTDSAASGLMIRFDPKQRHQVKAGKTDKGDTTLIVNKLVSSPDDISTGVVPEQLHSLKPGQVIESTFTIGTPKQ